jgi:ABC-type amino acid transport substrate-binding protein/heat shock protein HslJ
MGEESKRQHGQVEKGSMSKIVDIVLMAIVGLAILTAVVFVVILLIGLLPGQTPVEVTPADASWEEIQAAGRMVVGTSTDHPPFAYYIGKELIDGFDIALMNEIGQRLGVQVEYRAYAFDALADALAKGQIDAAVAALSASPERTAILDFSTPYFVTVDAILAYFTSPMDVDSIQDLAGYRVGMQQGSVHEQWLRRALVDTGLTDASNLVPYATIDGAVTDLTAGRIDFVILDLPSAKILDRQVGLRIAGQGLSEQAFAVALPKGATALRAEIDRAIGQLQAEGRIAQLAGRYLGPQTEAHQLTATPGLGTPIAPAPPATPEPTTTPEPPSVQSFAVSPDQISTGACVSIAWSVAGGASGSRILRNGTVIADNAGLSGEQTDCPDQAGSYTYRLEAYNEAGHTVTRERTIAVTGSAADNPLGGTQWQVISYYDANHAEGMAPVLSGTSLTAIFGSDGQVNGSAGCNSYSASYTVDGSLLAISPAAPTARMCETPEGIMAQETAFMAAMASAGSFAIDGEQLHLLNASGQLVMVLSGQ